MSALLDSDPDVIQQDENGPIEDDSTAAKRLRPENKIEQQSAEFSDFSRKNDRFNLLIACTGSVASLKLPELLAQLKKDSAAAKYADRLCIKIIVTDKARYFFDDSSIKESIYDDKSEWTCWKNRGDPVLHIELRKWADALLIAPLDANTLAKIANGLCDNLVTCVVRAWDFRRPIYFCPAMNTLMWEHPLTVKHLEILKGLLGFREIPCIEKQLICGDSGYGAMASLPMISSVMIGEVKKRFAIYSG